MVFVTAHVILRTTAMFLANALNRGRFPRKYKKKATNTGGKYFCLGHWLGTWLKSRYYKERNVQSKKRKAIRRWFVSIRHGRHVLSQCPKQRHFPPVLVAIFNISGGWLPLFRALAKNMAPMTNADESPTNRLTLFPIYLSLFIVSTLWHGAHDESLANADESLTNHLTRFWLNISLFLVSTLWWYTTQPKTHNLFRVDENSLEQSCATQIVQCCQQYCSALLSLN